MFTMFTNYFGDTGYFSGEIKTNINVNHDGAVSVYVNQGDAIFWARSNWRYTAAVTSVPAYSIFYITCCVTCIIDTW